MKNTILILMAGILLAVSSCKKSPSNPSSSGTNSAYYCVCSWQSSLNPPKDTSEYFYYPASDSEAVIKTDCETTKTQWAQGKGVNGGNGLCLFE